MSNNTLISREAAIVTNILHILASEGLIDPEVLEGFEDPETTEAQETMEVPEVQEAAAEHILYDVPPRPLPSLEEMEARRKREFRRADLSRTNGSIAFWETKNPNVRLVLRDKERGRVVSFSLTRIETRRLYEFLRKHYEHEFERV